MNGLILVSLHRSKRLKMKSSQTYIITKFVEKAKILPW